MYTTTTHDVTVTVETSFLDKESAPDKDVFVWSYTVSIENHSDLTLQLRTRHWKITDGYGRTQEVRGPGVIGEQPVLKPGQRYEYTSGTPLNTPSGIMVGSYAMEDATGTLHTIDIPAFSLDAPGYKPALN